MQHDIIEAYTGSFFCSLCDQEWSSFTTPHDPLAAVAAENTQHGARARTLYHQLDALDKRAHTLRHQLDALDDNLTRIEKELHETAATLARL